MTGTTETLGEERVPHGAHVPQWSAKCLCHTWDISKRLSEHRHVEVQLFLLQLEQSGEEQLRVLVVFPSNKQTFSAILKNPQTLQQTVDKNEENRGTECLILD